MKPLEETFTRNKFVHTVVKREGDVALVAKYRRGGSPHVLYFEVVYVVKYPEYTIGGVTIPAHEGMPGSNQWGKLGFSPFDITAAMSKFKELANSNVQISLGEDDLVPETDSTDDSEPDSVAPVAVAPKIARRPRGSGLPEIVLPDVEFSIKEAAALNPSINPTTVYLGVKAEVEAGRVKTTRTERRAERGKPTQLYIKVQA